MRRRKFFESGNITPDQIVRHALVQRLYIKLVKMRCGGGGGAGGG